MKRQQVGRNSRRRTAKGDAASLDIWRVPDPLPAPQPIALAQDVGALVRSLGEPPMNSGPAGLRYVEMVVERSAAIAHALAFSADVLATPER